MAQISVRRFINSLKHLSLETTLGVFSSFFLVLVAAFITPFLLRYLLLPRTVTHQEHLDFTFSTCDDQLSGVCSYPEAILHLEEPGISLSPGYYYSAKLTLELFDSEQNGRLGLFQAQLSAKDASGKVISSFKKPLLFRKSFFYSTFILLRNIVFFPFYLLGFFSSSDSIQTIVLTNQLYESSARPTAYLSVQIQNRYVQVASANLEIRASVGLSAYLFNEFPISSFLIIFIICFSINFGIFFLYWGTKGLNVYVQEPEEEELVKDKQGIARTVINYFFSLITSIIPGFPKSKPESKPKDSKPPTPEPSPDVWNKDEVPENPTLEDIPGWDILPSDDEADPVKTLHDKIEKHTSALPNDFANGTRKRIRPGSKVSN